MAHSDPLFRFEIVLEDLKSYVNKKQFIIKSQFADVFSLVLRDPLEQEQSLLKIKKPRGRFRGKGRNIMAEVSPKVLSGQSVLFTSNIDELISYMMQYPMEISFWNKKEPDSRIGSTVIPWNPAFVEFLARLYKGEDPPPVVVKDTRNVFDELTSKRMATIKLVIKMSYIPETAPVQFKYILEKKASPIVYPCISKKSNTLNTEKRTSNTRNETGVIKTFYSGGKRKQKYHSKTKKRSEREDLASSIGIEHSDVKEMEHNDVIEVKHSNVKEKANIKGKSFLNLIRSDTNIDRKTPKSVSQIKSCTSIKPPNNLNYIFNDQAGRFGNKVYTVGYLTVESIPSRSSKGKESKRSSSASKSDKSSKTSSKTSKTKPDDSSKGSNAKPEAAGKGSKTKPDDSSKSSKDKPDAAGKGSKTKPDAAGKGAKTKPDASKSKSASTTSSKKDFSFRLCAADCPAQKKTPYAKSECTVDLPESARELISVIKCEDITCFYKKERPPTNVRNEETTLDLSSLTKPCCVTTVKEHVMGLKAHMSVDPCSCACECLFFGKKTTYCHICGGYEAVGDDTAGRPHYLMPPPCPIYHRIEKKKGSSKSNSESEIKKKREKPGKKRKFDSRFKFNYGYKAPQIGHSQCAMPCSGHMNNVPKRMGWLWTADNVPGLPFRPQYKPGAVNKFVVRLLKQARNPGQVAKKRKKDTGKRKRPLKRPLLIVHKKDGEYCVTMETMKPYAKQRAINQPPYEDKDPVMYTIGRTEEENRERKRKKERAQRRLEREQRDFIQSAFKDMCKDICIKTYQQALGISSHTEMPECVCYPALPGPEHTNLNRSCSCSEDDASLASDTDSDEWIVEFTPPSAHFDPTFKSRKVQKDDAETQYSYLDYRVKLLDFSGNQVPRYFKGLDGKELCSDLGGFWGPDHQWVEINVDGFIAPDGRWAPNIFTGPNGEQVDAESGRFQMMDGGWATVGVDGYVDSQNKWKFYPRRKPTKKTAKVGQSYSAKKGGGEDPKSNQSWSCFGDVSPVELSKMGITGHGIDRKMLYKALKDLIASGRKDVKLPDLVSGHPAKSSKKGRRTPNRATSEQVRCRHATPSDKGIVIDNTGHKRYFRAHGWRNPRPHERMVRLERQGKSLSSFHKPCFHSFINHDTMMAQQRERLMRMAAGQTTPKSIAVQTVYRT